MDLFETVVSDIEYIENTWNGKVSNHTLRRGSTILRMLLVQNDLQKAWKAIGFSGEPHIIAPRLESILDVNNEKLIYFGLAAGGEYDGVELALATALKGDRSQIRSPESPEDSNINYKFKLNQFKESCGVFMCGLRIKRREIITYVANKLGGAHLDFNRKSKGDNVYKILDKNKGAFRIENKDIIYFELLSIGQCISKSPDIKLLVNKVKTELLQNKKYM